MVAGQSLGPLKQQPSDFLSFLHQNKVLLILLAFGHLMTRLVVFLFMRTAYLNATRSNRFGWLYQTYERIEGHLPKLAVLFVFLGLFDFINLNILCSLIKTDKLVIETTHLVDSLAKVKETKARPVVYEAESDYKQISESPRGSQLFRLFHSRFEQKDGFYLIKKESPDQDLFNLLDTNPSTYFLFMNRGSLINTAFLGSSFFENLFFKPINYYETLSVTYMRKNLEKTLKSDLAKK